MKWLNGLTGRRSGPRCCLCQRVFERGWVRALRNSQFTVDQQSWLYDLAMTSQQAGERVQDALHTHYCIVPGRYVAVSEQVDLLDVLGWAAAAVHDNLDAAEQEHLRDSWRVWTVAHRGAWESRRWMLSVRDYHRSEAWLLAAAGWTAAMLHEHYTHRQALPSREQAWEMAGERGVLLPESLRVPSRAPAVRAVAPEEPEDALARRYASLLDDE